MIRRQFTVLLAAIVFLCPLAGRFAAGQDWAKAALDTSPRHREYVPIQASGRTINTFVVYPEVSGKAPVVVLVHEIFGLSDWAKLMADELAAKGYIVLAPDLLSGSGPGTATSGTERYTSMDDITKAVSGLPAAQVLADLDGVADFGLKLPSANGKLAVAGFCWGGGKAFAFATHRRNLAAAFIFYGPPPPAAAMSAIAAPVYGFYAANDARISATIPQTVSDMKAAGKRYDPVTYAGAGHGFMRAGQAPDATTENRKAWEDGFARMTMLLHSMQ